MSYRDIGDGCGMPLREDLIAANFLELFQDEWDDLTFPAQGIDQIGAATDPTRVTSLTGYTGALSFSGSAENIIAVHAQMKHSWKRGSAIVPHIHWTKPTGSADVVTWELYYRHVGNPGDVAGAWVGPVTPTATIGDPTTSDEQLLTYWPSVSMTGKLESAGVYFQIRRQGDDDAEANAVILHEFDVHFQKDKKGTVDQIPS
jgi:hypothetical protein